MAQKDIKEISFYISQYDIQAAQQVIQNIYESAEILSEYPFIGRCRNSTTIDIRELPVPNTPYLLPYRITKSTIQILRVYHESRIPPMKW